MSPSIFLHGWILKYQEKVNEGKRTVQPLSLAQLFSSQGRGTLSEYKVYNEKQRQDNECCVEFFKASRANLQDDIAKNSQADAISDRVSEYHGDHGDESGECFAHLVEVHFLNAIYH